MKNTKEWVEKVAQVLEIEEKHGKGQKLATALGVGPATIMNQLKEKSEMMDEQATKVARILGVLPMLVISSTNYHKCIKSNDKENAEMWKKIYEKTNREQTEQMELENGIA